MVDIQTLPLEKQFSRRLIAPDSWIINGFTENMAAPHPHVLVGDEYALVIDPTDLPFNVRAYAETVAPGKKLMVALTHSHVDHAYNCYQFNECPIYMSAAAMFSAACVLALGMGISESKRDYFKKSNETPLPEDGYEIKAAKSI